MYIYISKKVLGDSAQQFKQKLNIYFTVFSEHKQLNHLYFTCKLLCNTTFKTFKMQKIVNIKINKQPIFQTQLAK